MTDVISYMFWLEVAVGRAINMLSQLELCELAGLEPSSELFLMLPFKIQCD